MINFDKILKQTPRVEYYPDYDSQGEREGVCFDGIQAISYDGADYKGLKTKIFAHIGFPREIKGRLPAVVLVHGGGGHPEDIWIRKWTDRGYAAIAMDTTGFFPTKPVPFLFEGFAEGLERRLAPPFYEEGYTVGPDNSCMSDMAEKTEDQWMYHAVASVILAHNILRSDDRIDSEKIGICGISWGGVIASIAIGIDARFRFAVPIYGSGFPREGLSPLGAIFKTENAEKWLPEKRFPQVSMPVMWLCWNDDCNFSVNSNSMSFLATVHGNPDTCLSMLHEMRHSHNEGYTPEESYWFADRIINGRGIPRVSAKYKDGTVYYSCSEKPSRVRLFYITEKMSYELRQKHRDKNFYMKQEWSINELSSEETSAPIPSEAVGRYVEFTLAQGVVLTSPYYEEPSVSAL